MSTEAAVAGKLSAPHFEYKLSIMAVAALPDIGRVIIIGIISFGIPMLSEMFPSVSHIISSAVLEANILTEHIKIINVGNSLIDVINPSRHPMVNSLNKLLFDMSIASAVPVIITGMEYAPINSIIFAHRAPEFTQGYA